MRRVATKNAGLPCLVPACVSAPKEDPSINRLKMLSWLVNLPSRRVPIGARLGPHPYGNFAVLCSKRHCLSASDNFFVGVNIGGCYCQPKVSWIVYSFPGRRQDATLHGRKLNESVSFTILSSISNDLRELISGGHQNECYVRVDEDSWSSTGVDKTEMYRSVDIAIITENQRGGDFRFGIKRYPWPICSSEFVAHDIQLAFHCGCLFLQSSNVLTGFLVGAAHGAPLQNGYAKSEKSSYGKSYSRDDQPFRYSYKWGLVGSLVISAAAALLGFAMQLGYKAFETPRLVVPAIGLGVISVAVIVHGLWYACLGVWGLPGLYVL